MDKMGEPLVIARWYVLHSHANKEISLTKQLELKQIPYYFPTLPVNPVNPRSRKYKPYFPGYLFVSLDPSQADFSNFQWMPHSAGLVSFGGEPALVPDNLIEALKQKLAGHPGLSQPADSRLKKGDAVAIHGGPFEGFEGIFQNHLSGKDRVQVLLKMLSERSVPLDLPDWQVGPGNKPRRRPG